MNFIDGKWVPSESGGTFRVNNPAVPGESLGEFQLSTKEDAKRAIDSARRAFPGWRNTPGPQRGKVLFKAAEIIEAEVSDFAKALTAEEGKTVSDATGEVRRPSTCSGSTPGREAG